MPQSNAHTILSYGKELLCDLSKAKIPFVFKGGTSLYIRFNNMNRISQDIDILVIKSKTIINKIREELIKAGYIVDYSEEGTYGALFEVQKKNWNNSISLDISQYQGKVIDNFYDETISINNQEIKLCNIYITFFEKLLAAHFATSYFNIDQNNNQNTIRKLRHFCDLHEMFSKNLINLKNQNVVLGRYIAYKNEIEAYKLSSIYGWKYLSIFDDDVLKLIEPHYQQWDGDEYTDKDINSKPTWKSVVKSLKEIQKGIDDVKWK